jgi:hypothetical protein
MAVRNAPESPGSRPRFRSFRAKLILLVAIAVSAPVLLTCAILGFQLNQQARKQFGNGLSANLATFSLILQDSERALFEGLKRTAADNTLQITLDLDMRSQLSNYTEAQRQVLGISFLGVYDQNSNAIAFSRDEQRGTSGNWRLQSSGEVAGDDCVAARAMPSSKSSTAMEPFTWFQSFSCSKPPIPV